jgi:hypothetical protein
MSFRHRKAMNRCWPPQTNPAEPERGTTRTRKEQAEGPSARAPTRHPTHLHRPSGGQATAANHRQSQRTKLYTHA